MRVANTIRKKYLFVIGVIVVSCFFVLFSMESYAAEGKVTASAAKIRKDASTTSEAIGSATNGQTFTISGETTGTDGKVWYQITFDGNKTGYIRSDLMSKVQGADAPATTVPSAPTAQVEALQPVSATITGSSVRVRSDASTQGAILAGVVKDSVVTITGRAGDNQGKTWYQVTFSSDTGVVTGFIREDFLTVSGTIAPVGDTPVVEQPPVEEEPPAEEIIPTTPPVITEDFYLIQEDGKWYLVDKKESVQYGVESLLKVAKEDPKTFADLQSKMKTQKAWIIILVILVGGLGVAVTLLLLKIREVMDDAYFAAIEKETIRQRQGQKANNSATAPKSKPVMHTVGANRASSQAKSTLPKPANTRPAQPKATAEKDLTLEKKASELQEKEKNAASLIGNKSDDRVETAKANSSAWQSKNFVDDDDEFEFEFLNWDGNDEN